MRLRRMLTSFLVTMALAMLPLAGGARAVGPVDQAVANQTLEPMSGMNAGESAIAAMDESSVDDCCLPHGAAGDPCKSAACCSVHCAAVTSGLQLELQVHLGATALVPIVRDQVLTSIGGSTPFRPPRLIS